jgi:phosphoadenosine phosphosulfate reductase
MALREQTVLGDRDKVQIAIDRIKAFEPPEGYFLAFSGGKDSAAIYELAVMSGVKFDAHYHVTTVDPPELVRHIRKNYPTVIFGYPKESMWQLIVKKGMPPTRIARYCCQILKEQGGNGRFVITGVRWAESVARSKRRMMERCEKGKGRSLLHPILDWSEAEVYEFLKERGVELCSLYSDGLKRLGCIGCPMATTEQRLWQFSRWPKYREAYMRAFDRMIKRNKEIGRKCSWDTAEQVMDWWLDNRRVDPNANEAQEVLF